MLLELNCKINEQENRSETSFEVQNITYTSPTGDGANVSDGSKIES
ncbi:ATP phosphoribosyltransferase [Pedobacter sp. BAL39]|nr:ATP phosphoribosyltransferase [Pedobacter sp. BAL39]